jgi:hypothetical protein
MMGLSLVAIPALLDTSTQAPQLLSEFVQIFDYGHKLMPSLAVGTFLLYAYTSAQKRAAGKPWLRHLAAGVTTIAIVPFTWIVMTPTNNELFLLHAESRGASGFGDLGLVQGLLVRWARLHVVRSLFPLAGALVGGKSILQQLGWS